MRMIVTEFSFLDCVFILAWGGVAGALIWQSSIYIRRGLRGIAARFRARRDMLDEMMSRLTHLEDRLDSMRKRQRKS